MKVGADWRVESAWALRMRHRSWHAVHIAKAIVHHRRSNRREAKVVLHWAGGVDDRIVFEVECVDVERYMCLRHMRVKRLCRTRAIEGVIRQCMFGDDIVFH